MFESASLKDLADAQGGRYALAAISVYSIDGALAVEAAAVAEVMPVILQAGSSAFRHSGEGPLARAVVTIAQNSAAQVHVHLDHSYDIDEIHRCLDAGYDSVMLDGSGLPLDENIAVTRRAVNLAHRVGAWVEGEVGSLGGHEDRSISSTKSALTVPKDAERFVIETGVDALAVSIGNVHGVPVGPVRLDLDRLASIRRTVEVPLVLHGASGLSDSDIWGAIELGVAKINVNADARRAFLVGLARSLGEFDDDLVRHMERGRLAMQSVVQEKIRLFARLASAVLGSRRP